MLLRLVPGHWRPPLPRPSRATVGPNHQQVQVPRVAQLAMQGGCVRSPLQLPLMALPGPRPLTARLHSTSREDIRVPHLERLPDSSRKFGPSLHMIPAGLGR